MTDNPVNPTPDTQAAAQNGRPAEEVQMPTREKWEAAVNQYVGDQLGGLTAVADQLKASDRELFALLLSLSFAFGVLAAIVALQGRKLKQLSEAVS